VDVEAIRRCWGAHLVSVYFCSSCFPMQVHPYVLPIMQGYCQIAKFTIPPDPLTHEEDAEVDYIIVSRRSRDRAGLRYQRRGIDDDAHVANFVETETIMRVEVCSPHFSVPGHTDRCSLARGSVKCIRLCSAAGFQCVFTEQFFHLSLFLNL
jgi:hypothetical protein